MRRLTYALMLMMIFCVYCSVDIRAESVLNGYSLLLADITDQNILDEIKMLTVKPCDDKWCLYVNNAMVKSFTGDNLTYEYQLEDNTLLKIKISLVSQKAEFTYQVINNYDFITLLRLTSTDDEVFLDVYYDLDQAEHTRLLGTADDDGYSFSGVYHQYTYQQDGQTYYFPVNMQFYLNKNTNILSVQHNDSICTYNITPNTRVQSFFLETLVEGHPLAIDYLEKDLPMKTFQAAKTELYDRDLIDAAVANEKLILKHEESGLTYQVDLKQFLTLWRRLATGEYDTTTTDTIQVVCQWQEAICESIRDQYQELGRLYALFGSTFTYEDVQSAKTLELVHKYLILYKNIGWPEEAWSIGKEGIDDPYANAQMRVNEATWNDWSAYTTLDKREDCEDDTNCTYSTRIMFKKQNKSWDTWSAYATQYPYECNDNNDCQWESSEFYNKRTAYWSAFSSYATGYPTACNDSADCRWNSLRFYRYRTPNYVGTYSGFKTTCSITDDHHCSRYYKYTCKKGSSSNTRYSPTSYALNKQGPCSVGYKVSSKQSGYRYRYIKWGSWSDYGTDSCTNVTGYKQCESQLRYATSQRIWSGWSGYNQTSCQSDDLTQCAGPTIYYREHKRNYDPWSDYIYTSCDTDEYTNCASQTQYAYRYRYWSGYTDWVDYRADLQANDDRMIYYRINKGIIRWDEEPGDSQLIGQGVMYQNESKTIDQGLQYQELIVAELIDKSLTTLPAMNEAAILDLADELATATAKQLSLKKLMRLNEIVAYDEFLAASVNEYLSEGQQLRTTFLNSEIFIPYIYVREHYRATMKDVSTIGYDEDLRLTSVKSVAEVKSLVAPLIQQWRYLKDNKVIFYDPDNPLYTYDELPDNWQAHNALLAALADLKINGNMITISLSKTDIKDIKDYLNDNDYQMNSCDILYKFSYLISDESGEFDQWLSDYKGVCHNVDSD